MSRSRRQRSGNRSAVAVKKSGSDLIQATGETVLDLVSGGQLNVGPRATEMETYWMLYAKHPWVSTCVGLIAEAVAAETFSVVPTDGSQDAEGNLDDERVGQIYQFFAHATPSSTFAALRLSTAVDLRVFGLGYWRKKRASTKGLPLYLERLDPRSVTVKLNAARNAIETFMLRKTPNTGLADSMVGAEAIPADDIVFFKMSGGDPLFGAPSPLEALDLTIAQDWSIRRHREAFFRNGGVPGRVIQIESADEDTAAKIQKRLKSQKTGVEAAFKDLVIPGRGVTIHESGASQGKNEFDFVKGSATLRDEIFAVFRVPPGKIFLNMGLGSAGKESDDDTFQRDAVLPVERVMYETLTRDVLAKEFDIHDLRMVPTRLSQMRLDRFDAAESLVKAGGTGNEARSLMNLPPIDGGGIDMDLPLFLGSRNPVVEQEAPATGDRDGDVTELDDQIEGQVKKARPRRRWRR